MGLGLGLGEGEGAGLGVSGSGCGFGVSAENTSRGWRRSDFSVGGNLGEGRVAHKHKAEATKNNREQSATTTGLSTTPPQVRGYQEHPRTSRNRGPEAHSGIAKLRCAEARRDVVRYVAGPLFDVRVAITHHKKKKTKQKNRLPGVGLGLGLGEGEGAGLGVSGSGCGFGVSGTCMALKSRVCQTK